MDTKQFRNDEEVTVVTGGNQTPISRWTYAVNSYSIPQLKQIAASAPAADQALIQGYIGTLRSTCGGDSHSAIYAVRIMLQPASFQDDGIRDKVIYVLRTTYEFSRALLS